MSAFSDDEQVGDSTPSRRKRPCWKHAPNSMTTPISFTAQTTDTRSVLLTAPDWKRMMSNAEERQVGTVIANDFIASIIHSYAQIKKNYDKGGIRDYLRLT